MMGIFAMRWNVVIGGQLFSKSFLGYTTYKLGLIDREGLLVAIVLTILPFVILWALIKLLPPWEDAHGSHLATALWQRLRAWSSLKLFAKPLEQSASGR